MEAHSEQEKRALETFHNPYSCAQAVYAAFSENPSDEIMAQMRANSGGRGPGNMCGALYAAHFLTDKSRHAELLEYFERHAGGTECRQIKKDAKTPCAQCVVFAVRAVMHLR